MPPAAIVHGCGLALKLRTAQLQRHGEVDCSVERAFQASGCPRTAPTAIQGVGATVGSSRRVRGAATGPCKQVCRNYSCNKVWSKHSGSSGAHLLLLGLSVVVVVVWTPGTMLLFLLVPSRLETF